MSAQLGPAGNKLLEIRPGVFFTPPEALPRGRHGIASDQIAKAQRERLLVAATELLAALGYRSFGAADIAKRAGVSLQSFYECFENKDACVFAGYDRFIGTLLKRMMAVPVKGVPRVDLVHAIVGSYLETLGSDPVVARAFQVEIDALGAPARERRRKSLTLFAQYLEQAATLASPEQALPEELNETAYLGIVYAVRQLASDAVEAAIEPDLGVLRERIEVWLRDFFRER